MPKKKHESPTTPADESPIVSSDADSIGGDQTNVEPTDEPTEDTAVATEPASEGIGGIENCALGSNAETPNSEVTEAGPSDNSVDVSTADATVEVPESGSPVEFKLEDVSDPLPVEQYTAKDYLGDTPFPSFKTPDGTVFNITVDDSRFQAESLDGKLRAAGTLEDTLDDFYRSLCEIYPAKTDPFTGQDVKTRLEQGIEGSDPTTPVDAPTPVVGPKVEVHLNYQAYINACSWFPTQVNMIGGQIVDDSDEKTVHVLVHNRDDFSAEWSHLLLAPVSEVTE